MSSERFTCAVGFVTLLGIFAVPASGQHCFERRDAGTRSAVTGRALASAGEKELGLVAARRLRAPLYIGGSYHASFRGRSIAHTGGVHTAVELRVQPSTATSVGLCPFGQLSYRSYGPQSAASEVGVTALASVRLSERAMVSSYLGPKHITRTVGFFYSYTERTTGLHGGVNLLIDHFRVGPVVERGLSRRMNAGVQGGIVF